MADERPTALVTGSASGIGRAAALRLARAGYDVVINYSASRDRAEQTLAELEGLGGRHLALRADVSDDAAVASMVAAVGDAYGRLDALVNNAGTTSRTPPEDLGGVDLADWDRVFAVNVRGLFQVTRACAGPLRAARGSVVNVASIVGLRPGPQPLAYAASKAAVVSLTRTLSRVLAPEVRVNAVAPGWIAGEWMRRTLGEDYERLMERRASWTPMKRNVTEEDVAETILSLITSNPFVTGETVVVDGGYAATTLPGLAVAAFVWSDDGMANTTQHTGRWTLEDRFASPWHYLPLEVPSGTAGLRVEFEYERVPGTVLDLGCLGPGGFRGWSGSARESFVITADGATPGYLPGEIEAGTWQVMIGVHRVPPDGVRYRLTATALKDGAALVPGAPQEPPAPGDRPPRRELPAGRGLRWLAGDLHTHTVHSDGVLTVQELAALAAARGLDFLAVTDHNTVSHHGELAAAAKRYGVILLPGQEVTTDGGHAGAFGDIGWIDFRAEPDDWLDATEARGGLLSVNHPFAGPVSWLRPMRRRPPLVEIWHWSWLDLRWTTPLSWWLAWDPSAIPVGGSDWHREGSDAPPGHPTTWVACAGNEPAGVLDGLRAGLVAISAERDGPVLLRHDGELLAVDADGTTLAGPRGPYARVRGDLVGLGNGAGPHRLLDPGGATLALCP